MSLLNSGHSFHSTTQSNICSRVFDSVQWTLNLGSMPHRTDSTSEIGCGQSSHSNTCQPFGLSHAHRSEAEKGNDYLQMPQASNIIILFDILLLDRSKLLQHFLSNKTFIFSDLFYFFEILDYFALRVSSWDPSIGPKLAQLHTGPIRVRLSSGQMIQPLLILIGKSVLLNVLG